MSKVDKTATFPTATPNGLPPSEPPPAEDEWDLESLRVGQDFEQMVAGRRILATVPVRKPSRQEFFRVRSGEQWRLQTAIFVDEIDQNSMYLVAPSLWPVLQEEIRQVQIFTCISRQQTVFLWPARIPGTDRRASSWHTSALTAAQIAMTSWIRMTANQAASSYDILEATQYHEDADWPPDYSFQDLIKIAFRDYYLQTLAHPVLQRLRGEL